MLNGIRNRATTVCDSLYKELRSYIVGLPLPYRPMGNDLFGYTPGQTPIGLAAAQEIVKNAAKVPSNTPVAPAIRQNKPP